jgi:hypothetical protein
MGAEKLSKWALVKRSETCTFRVQLDELVFDGRNFGKRHASESASKSCVSTLWSQHT